MLGANFALDPPSDMVAQAIASGATAATCSVSERGDELGYVLLEGDEALATVQFRPKADQEPRTRVIPLLWTILLAARGAVVEDVRAPDQDQWTWTAASTAIVERTLPAGLILPEPVARRTLWLLVAHDDRGLSAALHSRETSISRMGSLGAVLERAVPRTTVRGASARVDRAASRLSKQDRREVVAGAVAEYLSTMAAATGSDGGAPSIEWELSSFDPLTARWPTVAASPRAAGRPARRRKALSSAALKALEEEAFGRGARSRRTLVSLDAPDSGSMLTDPPVGLAASIADPHDSMRSAEQRLELTELASRAGLSAREREVLGLRAADHKEHEIAAILGISRNAVSTHLSRSRKKLQETSRKSPEEGVGKTDR